MKWEVRDVFGDKKNNICIIGGGNIGTLLIGDIGSRENVSLRLLTSRPDEWSNEIEVYNINDEFKYVGKVDIISDKPFDVIPNADIIILTVPSHVFPKIIINIEPFIKKGTLIGVMPGSGGAEFYCKRLIEKGCILFGFERVHGIARIKEYGKSVYDLGKKNKLHIASIPTKEIRYICMKMEQIFKVRCKPLNNYLNVTLTPSNPILHTTRIYTLLYNYKKDTCYNEVIKFYEDWNNDASKMLFLCDKELQDICRMIKGLDLRAVKSLKEYYESETIEEMTEKIRNIDAFKGIGLPMLEIDKGYIPDFFSRYFLEDFPFGLCIIKGFSDIVGIDTPNIDKILRWFQKISKLEYYVNGKFEGKDLKNLPLPRNYGLNSIEDIILFYS